MERCGVVWHTQGSGKSLIMVFLVRKMRTELDLKGYKILLVERVPGKLAEGSGEQRPAMRKHDNGFTPRSSPTSQWLRGESCLFLIRKGA